MSDTLQLADTKLKKLLKNSTQAGDIKHQLRMQKLHSLAAEVDWEKAAKGKQLLEQFAS